jgi:hypothetical protein
MISELTLAITSKLPMQALAETVHCYPTQAEAFQRIALDYMAKQGSGRQKMQVPASGSGRSREPMAASSSRGGE